MLPPIDDFLDSSLASELTSFPSCDSYEQDAQLEISEAAELVAYEGIDPRLKQLSHSSRTSLHKCPRKFQLYRLNSKETGEEDISQNVTFAFGSAVGIGLQSTMEDKSETQILMDVLLGWSTDLLDSNPKQKKSIWEAIFATQKFMALRDEGYLQEYELVYWEGKPAVELSFRITLPGGFTYRGFVDAVLRHKETGEILVLEAKTSSSSAQSAQYKNSGQALGYAVVLDKIFPGIAAYEVLYLVYETKSREYAPLLFEKSLLQRALWLQELLIDCHHVELYEEYQTYPMHGESCYDFFRECEYLGLCTLSTERLVKPYTRKDEAKLSAESYTFELNFYDLVQAQIDKGEVL